MNNDEDPYSDGPHCMVIPDFTYLNEQSDRLRERSRQAINDIDVRMKRLKLAIEESGKLLRSLDTRISDGGDS
ncbi:MAG: hypothetical protein JO053_01350 [Acidobacteria bacterium]|nr:hypothetical protein [Acidobacteriota bacterium]